MARILIVDDEASLRETLSIMLRNEGYQVDVSEEAERALQILAEQVYDLVITDMAMPGMDGLELLKKIKQLAPDTEVMMMTAYGSTESAVEAMKKGAIDYLLKPFRNEDLKRSVRQTIEKVSLLQENVRLKRELSRRGFSNQIIGESPAMKNVYAQMEMVASTHSNVLILGSTGTGKELVARSIHERSARAKAAFISVNCGAIPENLMESELFGYMRGAFTGATANKRGLLEMADGGTFFFDEIGELPLAMQV